MESWLKESRGGDRLRASRGLGRGLRDVAWLAKARGYHHGRAPVRRAGAQPLGKSAAATAPSYPGLPGRLTTEAPAAPAALAACPEPDILSQRRRPLPGDFLELVSRERLDPALVPTCLPGFFPDPCRVAAMIARRFGQTS